jgi:hypothetical protein
MLALPQLDSLTAAQHDGAVELRSGRKNGFAEVEQKNFICRQIPCQHFMITVSEGANRVSITICAQKLRV